MHRDAHRERGERDSAYGEQQNAAQVALEVVPHEEIRAVHQERQQKHDEHEFRVEFEMRQSGHEGHRAAADQQRHGGREMRALGEHFERDDRDQRDEHQVECCTACMSFSFESFYAAMRPMRGVTRSRATCADTIGTGAGRHEPGSSYPIGSSDEAKVVGFAVVAALVGVAVFAVMLIAGMGTSGSHAENATPTNEALAQNAANTPAFNVETLRAARCARPPGRMRRRQHAKPPRHATK